jgi:hypothetical protein
MNIMPIPLGLREINECYEACYRMARHFEAIGGFAEQEYDLDQMALKCLDLREQICLGWSVAVRDEVRKFMNELAEMVSRWEDEGLFRMQKHQCL